MPWRTLVVLAVLNLGGCASTPPSSFYLLSVLSAMDGPPTPADSELAIGLGPVSFPVFLDRPQIVTQTGGNRLAVDEFHRWGGTLQDDFMRVWSENLARLLGTSRILILPSEVRYPLDVRIAAEVLAFQGTADAQALLKVRWVVLDPNLDRVLAVRESRYQRPLAAPKDENALIAALSATLADFSREVATLARDLPKQAPAFDEKR
nr:PqiC family protein [Thiocystis violascens]